MKYLSKYILLIALAYLFTSCEKIITVDVPAGKQLIYVDGFISNKPGVQSIKLLQTTNYTDAGNPVPITGATVTLTDLTTNSTYIFTYQNGSYNYTVPAGNPIGIISHKYTLTVTYKGAVFKATDEMKRVPVIDSITYQYKDKTSDKVAGYYAKFFVKDLAGATDYYWIRTYKNGVLNNYVNEWYSIDGSFDEGLSDGQPFIYIISEGITSGTKPYVKGDTVKVVLRSLSKSTHDFINKAITQIGNGGMFAKILENVPTNITNTTPGNELRVYGWFTMVGESEIDKIIN